MTDTIFALASGAGRAGIAVIRLSGPQAGSALAALAGRPPPPPRRATLARLRSAAGEVLDDALLLWFPAPRSYTGEDVAELHLHGGRAVVAGVLDALGALSGLRPAEPGEFSRRAFHRGKLDLTAIEGLADLIDAETAAQRRQALRQLGGGLAERVEGWRERLVRLVAHLEAEIDFADEDLPGGLAERSRREATALAGEIDRHLADGHRGEVLREGFSVAIVGPPNAGKSSLLNALARRDVAIVSETAGTTRDVIEVRLDLGGYPVILADTAGLRHAADAVEAEGIRRARARAEAAHLRLLVLDAAGVAEAAAFGFDRQTTLLVGNKADLAPPPAVIDGRPVIAVSALTGFGMTGLITAIEERVRGFFEQAAEPPLLTRSRHRYALEACASALRRSLTAPQADLAAEDARLALRALGRITGRVDVEDLLDVIFRDFCIGK